MSLLDKLPTWLRNFIDHNRYLAGASLLALAIGGCEFLPQPKTESPFDKTQVTEEQLSTQAEVYKIQLDARVKALETEAKEMQVKLGAAYQDIDNKEARVQAIYDGFTGLLGSYGNEVGLPIAGIMSILFAATGLDNRRKDAVIEDKKQENRVLLASTASNTSAGSNLA